MDFLHLLYKCQLQASRYAFPTWIQNNVIAAFSTVIDVIFKMRGQTIVNSEHSFGTLSALGSRTTLYPPSFRSVQMTFGDPAFVVGLGA